MDDINTAPTMFDDGTDDNTEIDFYEAASIGDLVHINIALKSKSSCGLKLNWHNEDDFGYTAFHEATYKDHAPVVRALLEAGARPDIKSTVNSLTPVFIAARDDRTDVLNILLDPQYSADVNIPIESGATPLGIASHNGHIAALKLLIAHGGDVNIPTNSGATPVYIASERGQTAALELLIAHGGDVNKVTNEGSSPLGVASWKGHVAVVKTLIRAGADIGYAKPSDGATALHFAAWFNHAVVARILLHNGADRNKQDNYGGTPSYWSTEYGDGSVARIITDYWPGPP